jgi:23S rRNA (guanosine2251-2'-O)-methyltransferase
MKEYWMFGKNPCKAALENKDRVILEIRAVDTILDELNYLIPKSIKRISVKNKELDALLPNSVHQGIAIKVKPLDRLHIDWLLNSNLGLSKNIVMILDHVTDPHNIGAIIRTASAFNVRAIITSIRNGAQETGVVAKSAAGGLEIVPIVEVANISEGIKILKKHNYWVFGLDGNASENVNVMKQYDNIAIVLGSEGFGMRDLVSKNCDVLVKIAISSQMESLNVSNAAAIALFSATSL